jgi:glycosyltransferase involved in cell wall biosynthesis
VAPDPEPDPKLRVLFVGRTRYRLPLDGVPAQKFEALREVADVAVLATAARGSGTAPGFTLVRPRLRMLDSLLFYLTIPLRAAWLIRRFRPDVLIAQSPYEGWFCRAARAIARRRVPIVVEVHGDWSTATRLYGSRLRRLVSWPADRIAHTAILQADGIRTISPYTTELVGRLGRVPDAQFPTFTDLASFTGSPLAPLPATPTVLFVGVLERYKNIDGLTAAWRTVAAARPSARLHIVGTGSRVEVVERLLADLPDQTSWSTSLPPSGVAAALDSASMLVLPSASEGLGRVVIEAFCRGRPVVASRVGGIVDIVTDGFDGILVEPGDDAALAAALLTMLDDPDTVARMAENAALSFAAWATTAAEYAGNVTALLQTLVAGAPAPDAEPVEAPPVAAS